MSEAVLLVRHERERGEREKEEFFDNQQVIMREGGDIQKRSESVLLYQGESFATQDLNILY
jgi:hypothetical protein